MPKCIVCKKSFKADKKRTVCDECIKKAVKTSQGIVSGKIFPSEDDVYLK